MTILDTVVAKIGNACIGAIAVIFVIYALVGAVEFIGIVVRAARKWLARKVE